MFAVWILRLGGVRKTHRHTVVPLPPDQRRWIRLCLKGWDWRTTHSPAHTNFPNESLRQKDLSGSEIFGSATISCWVMVRNSDAYGNFRSGHRRPDFSLIFPSQWAGWRNSDNPGNSWPGLFENGRNFGAASFANSSHLPNFLPSRPNQYQHLKYCVIQMTRKVAFLPSAFWHWRQDLLQSVARRWRRLFWLKLLHRCQLPKVYWGRNQCQNWS